MAAISVKYPCVLWETHYEVVAESFRNGQYSTDERIYKRRVDAEIALPDLQLHEREHLSIREYEVVFFAHCVVCGEFPDQDDDIHPDWCWVLETLADYPGWLATPEQLVFCPAHRPDGEGA